MKNIVDKDTNQIIEKMMAKYPSKILKKGTIVVDSAAKNIGLLYVRSGLVRTYAQIGDAQIEQSVGMSLFENTLLFLLTKQNPSIVAEVITEAEIVHITEKEFWMEVDMVAGLKEALIQDILKKVAREVDLSRKLLGLDATGKVAKIVLQLDENKSKNHLTHKLIGTMTGLTRETVTLQLLKLEKMKLVNNKNRKVIILNKAELQKIAGER